MNAPLQRKATIDFRASGYFVLRAPLLPLEELERWTGNPAAAAAGDDPAKMAEALETDRREMRERLRMAFTRPEISDALFIASPILHDELGAWARAPDSKDATRAEVALVRYFVRMAGRPTPFGLFSACSVGSVGSGEETRLHLKPRADVRRTTRLDGDYLFELSRVLNRDQSIRRELEYRPNTSLYLAAGRLRYAEARSEGKVRTHHLVALAPAEYLLRVLEAARGGARPETLVNALLEWDRS